MQTTEKIILGTAQLGLHYGINNNIGKPASAEINKIFDLAKDKGIFLLDTAEAYGDALNAIAYYHNNSGSTFQIISKFKISGIKDLVNSVEQTNKLLGLENLYAYLLHDADKVLEPEVEDQFGILKDRQLIQYSGVSVYTNAQFEQAVDAPYIDLIQLPYNLLDNDFNRGSLISKAKSQGKIIHTRSVFLQGLFFMDRANLPPRLKALEKYIVAIGALGEKYGVHKVSMALQYALGNELIDGVLIGVDSAAQLTDNINASAGFLPSEVLDEINKLQVKESELLNPANWN